jgi:hypothetical protein
MNQPFSHAYNIAILTRPPPFRHLARQEAVVRDSWSQRGVFGRLFVVWIVHSSAVILTFHCDGSNNSRLDVCRTFHDSYPVRNLYHVLENALIWICVWILSRLDAHLASLCGGRLALTSCDAKNAHSHNLKLVFLRASLA